MWVDNFITLVEQTKEKTMTDIQKELNEAEEMLQDAVNEKMELLTLVRS